MAVKLAGGSLNSSLTASVKCSAWAIRGIVRTPTPCSNSMISASSTLDWVAALPFDAQCIGFKRTACWAPQTLSAQQTLA